MRLTAAALVCLGQLALAVAAAAAPAYRPIPVALHVHSTWSSGNLSLEDLATLASARGIEAVLLADNHLQRFEYGLSPLRGLLRYRVDYPSVVSKGPEAFLQAVESANARRRDVLIVPGVEVIPQYFWTGSLWDGSLTMHNGQKNLLALGLYTPEDYWELPAVGNTAAAPWSLWLLWPAFLVIPGIWLLRSTRRRVVRGRLRLDPRRHGRRVRRGRRRTGRC